MRRMTWRLPDQVEGRFGDLVATLDQHFHSMSVEAQHYFGALDLYKYKLCSTNLDHNRISKKDRWNFIPFVTSPYDLFYENDKAPCKLCKSEREIERKNEEKVVLEEDEEVVEIEAPCQCDISQHEASDDLGITTQSYLISSPIGTLMFLFFADKASVVHSLNPGSSNFPYEIDIFGAKYIMHAKAYSTERDGSHFYSKMKIDIDGEEVLCKIDNLNDSKIVRLSNNPEFFETLFNRLDDYDVLICYKKK